MTFKRDLWVRSFSSDHLPKFPCPSCADGRLIREDEASFLEEPTYSKLGRHHPDFDPLDWITERFSERLRCDNDKCGEIVIMSGSTTLVEAQDEEIGWVYVSALVPEAFVPAPPIIAVPENAPHNVISSIRTASSLFWQDVGSAANRLRTSVEYVLGDLKIPTETINHKGNTELLDLNGRIQLLEKQSPEQAKTFHALRMVGNLGSHTNHLKREAFLDAAELYEDALTEIYGHRKAYLDELKKKLLKTKGKY